MTEIIRYLENYIYPISKIIFTTDYKHNKTFIVFTDNKFKCFITGDESDFLLAAEINTQDLIFENIKLDLELKNQVQIVDNDTFNKFEIIGRVIDRHRLTDGLLIKDYRGNGSALIDETAFCNMMNITNLTINCNKIVNNLTWAFDGLTMYPTLINSELYQKYVAPKGGCVDKWFNRSKRREFG